MVRLNLVSSTDAPRDIRGLYDEIERTLHIPWTDDFVKALAAYPAYLHLAWRHVAPSARTQQFVEDARTLRELADNYTTRAYTPSFDPPLLDELGLGPGDRADLRDAVLSFEYGLPRVLLLATALRRAIDGEALPDVTSSEPAQYTEEEQRLALVPNTQVTPEIAPTELMQIYDDIMRATGIPLVHTFYQTLANWLPALDLVWQDTRPLLATPDYAEAKTSLEAFAWMATNRFTEPVTTTPEVVLKNGLLEQDLPNLHETLHVFADLLPSLLLNIAVAWRGVGSETPRAPAR